MHVAVVAAASAEEPNPWGAMQQRPPARQQQQQASGQQLPMEQQPLHRPYLPAPPADDPLGLAGLLPRCMGPEFLGLRQPKNARLGPRAWDYERVLGTNEVMRAYGLAVALVAFGREGINAWSQAVTLQPHLHWGDGWVPLAPLARALAMSLPRARELLTSGSAVDAGGQVFVVDATGLWLAATAGDWRRDAGSGRGACDAHDGTGAFSTSGQSPAFGRFAEAILRYPVDHWIRRPPAALGQRPYQPLAASARQASGRTASQAQQAFEQRYAA